jgi:general secretion pathway protein A
MRWRLRYTIENRRAAALVCGPSGVGKTILVSTLRRQLSDNFRPICQVVFPMLTGEQLLRYMIDLLDPESVSQNLNHASAVSHFERLLNANLDARRHAVVVIDEAHLLEQNGLIEPLRLLLNIAADRGPGESAWTLVLVGQHTLLSQVERYREFDERLAVKCLVNRFQPEETGAYIQHRIRAAGGAAEQIFTPAAIDAIHHLAQGIPRRINRLCDLAMMVGYAEDLTCIDEVNIDNVQKELAVHVS